MSKVLTLAGKPFQDIKDPSKWICQLGSKELIHVTKGFKVVKVGVLAGMSIFLIDIGFYDTLAPIKTCDIPFVLSKFNNLDKNLKFTDDSFSNGKINFLCLKISEDDINVYWKDTKR